MAPVNARSSVDPRWTRHNVRTAAGFMLAEIEVRRKITTGDDPTYNFETGTYDGTEVVTVWRGKARVQPFGIIGDQIVAQDPTGRRLMRVQIEQFETGIQVDDEIEVTHCQDNPDLEQFRLEVRGTISSSNAWLTDLVAEANVKAHNGA